MTDRREILDRYRVLYSAIVSDCVEELGHGPRAPRHGLMPFHRDSERVAVGYAYPIQIHRTSERVEIDMLLKAVDATPADSMIVVAADEDVHGALWGGLMTESVISHGGLGAVVDGGIRDLHQVLPLNFPVWAEYRSPLDIRGRAEVVGFGEPVSFRGVPVAPGELVFADACGVVAVPAGAELDVLAACERRLGKELQTAEELKQGLSPTEVYERYGAF
jgi:regulator of RNase E activity RraA